MMADNNKQNKLTEEEKAIKRESIDYIRSHLMDTPEDREKFQVLRSLDGKINDNGKPLMYSVIFVKKKGIYHPIVVLDNTVTLTVKDRKVDLINEIFDYQRLVSERRENTEKDKKTKGEIKKLIAKIPKPEYLEPKFIPQHERYQYFIYKEVTYKFNMSLFWDDSLDINTVDDEVLDYIQLTKTVDKNIYDDVRTTIMEYYFHMFEFEYDVITAFSLLTYLYQLLGRVIYLDFLGGPGTGKTQGIEVLSYTMRNGFITGMGTIPSTVRKIEYQQISLAQDEFEKMGDSEKIKFIGVMNAGFNPRKNYDITNLTNKDPSKQSLGFKTFCPKAFTCNGLWGFDISFLDRLYVIQSIKANKTMKDIYYLTEEDLKHFQALRNKQFIYVLNNWKDMLNDIKIVKRELETDKVVGRDADKLSIILGIIRNFKGETYSNNIKEKIKKKAPLEQMEKQKTMEEIILEELVNKCKKDKQPTITIESDYLHTVLWQKLGYESAKTKGAPSNQKPHYILKNLGLILNKENKGRDPKSKRTVYNIYAKDLIFVLQKKEFKDLLSEISPCKLCKPFTPFTESGKEFTGFKGFTGQKIILKIKKMYENSNIHITENMLLEHFEPEVIHYFADKGILKGDNNDIQLDYGELNKLSKDLQMDMEFGF